MLVGAMVISASIAGLSVYFFVQLFTRRICAEIMSRPMVGHRWSCLSVCVFNVGICWLPSGERLHSY